MYKITIEELQEIKKVLENIDNLRGDHNLVFEKLFKIKVQAKKLIKKLDDNYLKINS